MDANTLKAPLQIKDKYWLDGLKSNTQHGAYKKPEVFTTKDTQTQKLIEWKSHSTSSKQEWLCLDKQTASQKWWKVTERWELCAEERNLLNGRFLWET